MQQVVQQLRNMQINNLIIISLYMKQLIIDNIASQSQNDLTV